jgi:iron complex outermembrane recepter protein
MNVRQTLARCAVIAITLPALAFADSARFAIRAEPLPAALKAFAQQAHMQLLYEYSIVHDIRGNSVSGILEKRAALLRLLRNTGLEPIFSSENAATIRPIRSSTSAGSRPASGKREPKDGKKSTSDRTPTAYLPPRGGSQPDPSGPSSTQQTLERSAFLSEIVVTAQKKSENALNVPVPVTVLNAGSLVDNNQLRLQDYYTSVPGLSVTPSTSGSGGSFQNVAIRGITTGIYTNPTVGITVDDVPYGSSTAVGAGGGVAVADIDPADLARIEVLRGPQGTLYGASSMGGLIKYVTVDPSTEALTGRVETDMNGVVHGAEPGYGMRGSVNIPLSSDFALRASAFTRQDAGYIDNVQTGQTGINEDHVSGGRVAALWQASPTVTLKLSALYQKSKGNGFADVELPINGYNGPPLSGLQESSLRGTGQSSRTVQAYSAILVARLGAAELTSVSGYNISQYADTYDLTYYFSSLTQAQFGVPGTPTPESDKTDKFSQEIRLSTPIGNHVDWLLGAFFTHESSRYGQGILAEDPSSGATVGDFYNVAFNPGYTEFAGFSDFTFHVTKRVDIQLGGRESHIRQTYSEVDAGPFLTNVLGETSPHVVPEVSTSADSFTYLVTPRLKISSGFMVYARIASGYRAGGPNLTLSPGIPAAFKPDQTKNYEIGAKVDLFHDRLSLDSSLYYIDWKDIQITETNPQTGLGYTGNGSEARSQGFELSVDSKPMPGLTLSAWITLADAEITQAFPSTSNAYGVSGDRLPYSSRFSGNFSLRRDFAITDQLMGFLGGSLSYVGRREGEFAASAVRQDLPAYARTDLQAGLEYAAWTFNLFVNNVADKRGILAGGLGSYPPFAFSYIQPRTVGLSAVRRF